MVQNAIEKEKGKKLASSSEGTALDKQTQDASGAADAGSDQKPVKNKNLQHRPLKRKPSTEKDAATSPPDKTDFKESEELQRIRQILNQGKKEKKPSVSENIEQENRTEKAENNRKTSGSKSSHDSAVNGLSDSSTRAPPPRSKTHGPNAGLHAYVESRKMNFEMFEVPPIQTTQSDEDGNEEERRGKRINMRKKCNVVFLAW